MFLPVSDVVAIEGPPRLDDLGVGGFLSPQRLSSVYWVAVDLVADRLLLIDADASSVNVWIDDAYPGLQHLSLERKSKELLVVDAAIKPHPPVATMLNTGTEESEFARAAVPHLRGDHHNRGLGVSGAEVAGQVISDQVLEVGEAKFSLPQLLVRDDMPQLQGMIGMDLLRGSVLVISPKADDPIHWLISSK